MRLTTHIRSLETQCVVVEGSDRDHARSLIGPNVPAGFEVVTVGFMALDSSVRACAIVRSTATEQIIAEGPTPEQAHQNLMAKVPISLRWFAERRLLEVTAGNGDDVVF